MRKTILNVTTNASGDAATLGDSVVGLLYAIQPIPGDLDAGGTFTLTSGLGDLETTIYEQTGIDSTAVYPRANETPVTAETGQSATFTLPLVAGNMKITIANGGDTKSGSFILYTL